MKTFTFLFLIWINLLPAWGQLFSPTEIDDIQDFYLHYETRRKEYIDAYGGTHLPKPYKLHGLRVGSNLQRPPDFQPYFWEDHGGPCRTSNTLRDTLQFEGKDILIFDSPLLDFKEIVEIVLPNKRTAISFGGSPYQIVAYRGYTAQWSIENDSLFLLRVTPYHEGGYFWGDSVAPEIMYPEIEELSGQRFINGKLFAGWVNGKIVGGSGGIYLRRELDKDELKWYSNYTPEEIIRCQYTGHYLYPEEYSFQIEQGIVKKTKHSSKK